MAHTPGLGVQSPLQSKMKWNFGVFHSHSRKYLELIPLSNPKLPGVLECGTHGVALRNALLIAPHSFKATLYLCYIDVYSQIWVQNSFLLELSNLVQSFYYDESENSRRDDQHENSSADPEEESDERDSHLNTLNNYLTWRAVQPFLSYLGKGKFSFHSCTESCKITIKKIL